MESKFPVRLLALLMIACAAMTSEFVEAQATPTPTRFDNRVINNTYIDVVSEYVVADLFAPPDQRYWPFLVKACAALTEAGVACVPSSTERPWTNQPSVPTATLGLRPFSSGQVAIPFQAFDRYLLTLVHTGTAEHAANTIDAINAGALRDALAVTAAHFVPDINAIYADGGSVAVGSGDAQLSIGWHVLLVLGVVLVYGLFVAARFRSQQHQTAAATRESALGGEDPAETHAHRWAEDDLIEKQEALLEKSAEAERTRNARARAARSFTDAPVDPDATRGSGGGFGSGATPALLSHEGSTVDGVRASGATAASRAMRRQLAACQRALDDVADGDRVALEAGTLSFSEAAAHGGQAALHESKAQAANPAWSMQLVDDMLDLDPRLALPPPSQGADAAAASAQHTSSPRGGLAGAGGNRSRRQRLMSLAADLDASKAAAERARREAEEEAAEARRGGSDSDDVELPPDAAEVAEKQRLEAAARDANTKKSVPLGFAARRIARMMTTLATDQSQLNPTFNANTVHRSYQLRLSSGAESALAQRRSLRHAQFVERTEQLASDVTARDLLHDSDGSPTASPSPQRNAASDDHGSGARHRGDAPAPFSPIEMAEL